MYNLIIRPLLFCIDPEKVHRMLLSWLKFYRYLFPVRACVRGYSRVSDPFSYGHLQFKNRIGLSAGFDKNAEAFDELADFGFGFLEVGTVTPDSQSGNPSPRIFRLVDDESLISRTGFNNCGVDAVRQHIRKYRKHSYVLGVNINKNPLFCHSPCIHELLYANWLPFPFSLHLQSFSEQPDLQELHVHILQ